MTEMERLKALLAAREKQNGYKKNVDAIKARIAELEAQDGGN